MPAGWRLEAWSGPDEEGRLRVDLRLTNGSERSRTLSLDECSWAVRLYRTSARIPPPAWDTKRLSDARIAAHVSSGCPAAGEPLVIAPGTHRVFSLGVPISGIRGDSLAEGVYHISAAIEIDGLETEVPAGRVELRRLEW